METWDSKITVTGKIKMRETVLSSARKLKHAKLGLVFVVCSFLVRKY